MGVRKLASIGALALIGVLGACGDVDDRVIIEVSASIAPAQGNILQSPSDSEPEPAAPAAAPIQREGKDPALDGFPGSTEARTLASELRERLVLQSGCRPGEPPSVSSDFTEAMEAIPSERARSSFEDVMAALDRADSVCDDFAAWSGHLDDAIRAILDLEAAFGTVPASAIELPRIREVADVETDPTRVSVDAMMAYDRAYTALTGRNGIQGSDFWYSSGHLGHVRGIRSLLAQGVVPELLAVGDSTTALSVDPVQLRDQTGILSANVAINGARLHAQIPVANQLLSLIGGSAPGTKPTIVWGVQTLTFFRGCPTSDDGISSVLGSQQEAFMPIARLRDMPALDRLLGADSAAPHYRGTQIDDDTYRQYDVWHFGGKDPELKPKPEAKARQIQQWSGVLKGAAICETEVDRFVEQVDEWERAGHRVVVFAVPLSDELAAFAPDGRDDHDDLVARLRDSITGVDGELVDLTDALDDAHYWDLLHLDSRGKQVVTERVAAAVVNG